MENQPLDGYGTPATSWPGSGIAATPASQWTPQRIKSKRTNLIEVFLQQAVLALQGFLSPGSGFSQLNSWSATQQNRLAAADADIIALDGRVTALEGGGTITTYTVSGTWPNPAPTEHKRIKVIVFCGGDGGGRPSTNFRDQAKGGMSGGYVEKEFWTDELPATVALTIGLGGAGATFGGGDGSVGDVSSFGSLLVGQKGVGMAWRDGGYVPKEGVPPGEGGRGGFCDTTDGFLLASTSGTGGGFAPGGRAGFGVSGSDLDGKNGAAAPADAPSGGGGGGGGSVGFSAAGNGGNGGFPGGPGGGAAKMNGNYGNGGNGAQGAIMIVMDA